MAYTLRPADPETDFPAIAALITSTGIEPVTVEELVDEETRIVAGKIRRRWVAAGDAGEIVGHCYTVRYPSQQAGLFNIGVNVGEAWRRQGIGGMLYEDAERFAAEQGATSIACVVPEQSPDGLRFAQKRGYVVRIHEIGAQLDLSTFDEGAVAGVLRELEDGGIRIFSLADAGNTPEAQRKLYEINRIASTDDPAAMDDSFPSVDTWLRVVPGASWFQPEGQIVAVDTHREDGMYVGMTGVTYDPDTNTAATTLTGVHREYRGRKLGYALKVHAVRFAREHGATHMNTTTDARNAAMQAINRKLGFREQPGFYELLKVLA